MSDFDARKEALLDPGVLDPYHLLSQPAQSQKLVMPQIDFNAPSPIAQLQYSLTGTPGPSNLFGDYGQGASSPLCDPRYPVTKSLYCPNGTPLLPQQAGPTARPGWPGMPDNTAPTPKDSDILPSWLKIKPADDPGADVCVKIPKVDDLSVCGQIRMPDETDQYGNPADQDRNRELKKAPGEAPNPDWSEKKLNDPTDPDQYGPAPFGPYGPF